MLRSHFLSQSSRIIETNALALRNVIVNKGVVFKSKLVSIYNHDLQLQLELGKEIDSIKCDKKNALVVSINRSISKYVEEIYQNILKYLEICRNMGKYI